MENRVLMLLMMMFAVLFFAAGLRLGRRGSRGNDDTRKKQQVKPEGQPRHGIGQTGYRS